MVEAVTVSVPETASPCLQGGWAWPFLSRGDPLLSALLRRGCYGTKPPLGTLGEG